MQIKLFVFSYFPYMFGFRVRGFFISMQNAIFFYIFALIHSENMCNEKFMLQIIMQNIIKQK